MSIHACADDAYRTCTTRMACSETCVRAYMDRYALTCTGGRPPTCEDVARIHNGGPSGCRSSATLRHWRRVRSCCDRKRADNESCDESWDDWSSSSVTPNARENVSSSSGVHVLYRPTTQIVSYRVQVTLACGVVTLAKWLQSCN